MFHHYTTLSDSLSRLENELINEKKSIICIVILIAIQTYWLTLLVSRSPHLSALIYFSIILAGWFVARRNNKITITISPEWYNKENNMLYYTIMVKANGKSFVLSSERSPGMFDVEQPEALLFCFPGGEIISSSQMGMEETSYGWQVVKLTNYSYMRRIIKGRLK